MDYVAIKKGNKTFTVTKRAYDIVYKDAGFIVTGEAAAPIEAENVNESKDETLYNASDVLSDYVNTVKLTGDTKGAAEGKVPSQQKKPLRAAGRAKRTCDK